jgi:hypothetical protein
LGTARWVGLTDDERQDAVQRTMLCISQPKREGGVCAANGQDGMHAVRRPPV